MVSLTFSERFGIHAPSVDSIHVERRSPLDLNSDPANSCSERALTVTRQFKQATNLKQRTRASYCILQLTITEIGQTEDSDSVDVYRGVGKMWFK
jgi:hypothetical protein